jgi:hypothetical protein
MIWNKLGMGLLICSGLLSCSVNPFDDTHVSGQYREMTGNAQLSDLANHEGIYVWLEGLNIGTTTDSHGEFTLRLPATAANLDISGMFSLYTYVANYHVDHAEVVVIDGDFAYNEADLNEEGRLAHRMVLKKFLDIHTEVIPQIVEARYTDFIQVEVTLKATMDSCSVILPGSINGLLGAVLVRNTESEDIHVYQYAQNIETQDVIHVNQMPRKVTMPLNLTSKPLQPGTYEIIPYIIPQHEPIPDGLMEGLGFDKGVMSPEYLNIPFQRGGGMLKITK